MNIGKVLGPILVVVGLIICLLAAAVSVASAREIGGRLLGAALGAIIAIPFVGVGVFMLIRGQKEAGEMAAAQRQKRLLGMVRAQGRVNVADAALELKVNRDQVKSDIYDLVNKGLFTGYINWNDGDLISADAAQMATNKCPRCAGELELAGKGVVRCPYCGTEIFLSG